MSITEKNNKPNYRVMLSEFERLAAIKNKVLTEEELRARKAKAEKVLRNKRRRFIASCFPPIVK